MFCLKCLCCKLGSFLGIGNKVLNKGIILVNELDFYVGICGSKC